MGLNDLNNKEIKQVFKHLISSASAILEGEQEKENQWLKNSFIHLIDQAKESLDLENKSSAIDLRQEFLIFIEKAEAVLEERRQDELRECFTFLEVVKTALYQDIQSKVTLLKNVLKRAKPNYDRINVFSVLNIARQEDPQSYFLAWLLNPDNPHGFGDLILRAFLKKACSIIGEFEYDTLKVTDVTITPQQNIGSSGVPDIEVIGENFICVIENKVGAGETLNDGIPQTKQYADYYTKQAKKDDKFLLLLYLVPPRRYEDDETKQPSDIRFKQILYSDILEVIESVLKTSTSSSEVSCLIEMFLYNIKREICHELDEYFEAESLLRESCDYSEEVLYNPSYFARPDKYEYLIRLTSKFSKGVMKNESGRETF